MSFLDDEFVNLSIIANFVVGDNEMEQLALDLVRAGETVESVKKKVEATLASTAHLVQKGVIPPEQFNALKAAADEVVGSVGAITTEVLNMPGGVAEVEKLRAGFDKSGVAAEGFGGKIGGATEKLASMVSRFGRLTGGAVALNQVFATLSGTMDGVNRRIAENAAELLEGVENLNRVPEATAVVQETTAEVTEEIARGAIGWQDWANEALHTIPLIKQVTSTIEGLGDLWDPDENLDTKLARAQGFFEELPDSISFTGLTLEETNAKLRETMALVEEVAALDEERERNKGALGEQVYLPGASGAGGVRGGEFFEEDATAARDLKNELQNLIDENEELALVLENTWEKLGGPNGLSAILTDSNDRLREQALLQEQVTAALDNGDTVAEVTAQYLELSKALNLTPAGFTALVETAGRASGALKNTITDFDALAEASQGSADGVSEYLSAILDTTTAVERTSFADLFEAIDEALTDGIISLAEDNQIRLLLDQEAIRTEFVEAGVSIDEAMANIVTLAGPRAAEVAGQYSAEISSRIDEIRGQLSGALDWNIDEGNGIRDTKDFLDEINNTIEEFQRRNKAAEEAAAEGLDAVAAQLRSGGAEGLVDDWLDNEGGSTLEDFKEIEVGLDFVTDLENSQIETDVKALVALAEGALESGDNPLEGAFEAWRLTPEQLLEHAAAFADDYKAAVAAEMARPERQGPGAGGPELGFDFGRVDPAASNTDYWEATMDGLVASLTAQQELQSQIGRFDALGDAVVVDIQDSIASAMHDIKVGQDLNNALAAEMIVADIRGLAETVGEDFTAGLAAGIEQYGVVEQAVANVTAAIKAAARLGLREESPSKDGFEIGEFFNIGIAEGILTGHTEEAIETLTGQIKSAGESLKSSLSGIFVDEDEEVDDYLEALNKIREGYQNTQDELNLIEERGKAISRLRQFGNYENLEESVLSGAADNLLDDIVDRPLEAWFNTLENEMQGVIDAGDAIIGFDDLVDTSGATEDARSLGTLIAGEVYSSHEAEARRLWGINDGGTSYLDDYFDDGGSGPGSNVGPVTTTDNSVTVAEGAVTVNTGTTDPNELALGIVGLLLGEPQ